MLRIADGMETPLRQDDQPSNGEVLITTETGVHFLSVVPHPHRLSFTDLSHAVAIATRWAAANGGEVWHTVSGKTLRLRSEKRSA
jgi:hypothetical protein